MGRSHSPAAALALGGVLGEWLQIDDRLARLGTRVSAWSGRTDSGIEGTVAAFLLFCIGPLTLLGSLSNGLTGNPQLLRIRVISALRLKKDALLRLK